MIQYLVIVIAVIINLGPQSLNFIKKRHMSVFCALLVSFCFLPRAGVGARADTVSRPQDTTVVLCVIQDGGGEVRHILPALHGTHPAEGREAGQAVPYGDPVHPTEEPLPSLPALQRARALPQQHLPGVKAPRAGGRRVRFVAPVPFCLPIVLAGGEF